MVRNDEILLTWKIKLMRKRFDKFEVKIELYNREVVFIFSEDLERVVKSVNRIQKVPLSREYTIHDLHGKGTFFSYESGKDVIHMCKIPKTPDELGTLTHEILHAVVHILDIAGLPLTRKCDEAYTYLMGFITRKALENISKIKLSKRK